MAQDIKTADIAIVGTGPAGISAAITAKIRNKEIFLFGAEPVSSKVAKAHRILNYPGLPAVSGEELAQAYKRHLDELQIAVTKKRVHAVYAMGSYFAIQAGQEQYRADSVILACGMTADKPFPGENEFLGRGVSYCATCDAQFFKGKTVAVIGYTKESVEEAQYLAEIVGKVLYFPMGKEAVLPGLSGNIEICTEKPAEITGTMKVEQLKTDGKLYPVDGIFILREAVFPGQLVPGLKTEKNHAAVNLQMETNVAGLFACGDIAGTPYQYIKAAGQGNVAALSAVSYLNRKKETV